MSRFEELESFVAVVDYDGFGSAADKLGVAKSMVSRRVSDLEHRLGVQLLQRTTRRQSLTDAGRDFYQRATQLIDDLGDSLESGAGFGWRCRSVSASACSPGRSPISSRRTRISASISISTIARST